MQFIKDISNVARTRKFWVGILTAVVQAAAVFLADQPEFAPLIGILGALGIYQVPNSK